MESSDCSPCRLQTAFSSAIKLSLAEKEIEGMLRVFDPSQFVIRSGMEDK